MLTDHHAQKRTSLAIGAKLRLFSYVIDHDVGFAPNPFGGLCTLAACKPMIRNQAHIGDYVIGTGSTARGKRPRRLIYWMKVNEVVDIQQYWEGRPYRRKRPLLSGSVAQQYGDNIYHRVAGELVQEDSFHSQPHGVIDLPNFNRDTNRTTRVLVGRDFAYYGADPRMMPPEYDDFIRKGQGHLSRFDAARLAAFLEWLLGDARRGLLAEPSDWPPPTKLSDLDAVA